MSKTTKTQSSMQIKFKTGTDSNGKNVYKNQKLSKVKVAAADSDVLSVGGAVSLLLPYSEYEISRIDNSVIINE